MIKGWIFKRSWENIIKKVPEKGFHVWLKKGDEASYFPDDWPPVPVVLFPADQVEEVKKYIENIRIMARNDPAAFAKEIIKDSEAALKILEGEE